MTSASASKCCARSARIVERRDVCDEHILLRFTLASFPASEPGQFLQLGCNAALHAPEREALWPADGFPSIRDAALRSPQAYLRRPFSLADHVVTTSDEALLTVISRSVGLGTRWLETLQVGDSLTVTGPLGRGFRLPPPPRRLFLVGGGVGIPPLLYLARRLHAAGYDDVTVLLGAQRKGLFPVPTTLAPSSDGRPTACVTYPGGARFPTIITSDDGSIGMPGRVTDALGQLGRMADTDQKPPLVFSCGPAAMLEAVAHQTRVLGWDCQLCIERHMGCGVGTCLSCVVRVHDQDRSEGWRWALTCTDGPVFDRDALLDEAGTDPR